MKGKRFTEEENPRAVGAQWELPGALARTDQRPGHFDASVRAHVDRRFPRVTALQAAFRTRTERSGSQNGEIGSGAASSSSRDR
jgi:hypothetical protein